VGGISGVVFCPHPPLLIPRVAGRAAAELDELRSACRAAIRAVIRDGVQPLLIGSGPANAVHGPSARGSLQPYGVPLEIPLGAAAPGPLELPLSLIVGAWLLRDALGVNRGARGWQVCGCGEPPELTDQPIALVVMGDGSARRSTSAPGYFDERAAAFDATVASALAGGNPSGLRVDATLGTELLAAGVPAWHAAADLLDAAGPFDATLRYDDAPYGVGYFVASWTPRA